MPLEPLNWLDFREVSLETFGWLDSAEMPLWTIDWFIIGGGLFKSFFPIVLSVVPTALAVRAVESEKPIFGF